MDCLAEGRRLKKMSDNREMCPNGHFYDKSKYTQCPHCAKGMPPIKLSAFTTQAGSQMEEEAKKKTEKKGLFAGWKRGKEKDTEMPWMTMRTWYRHSDHWRSGRNDERRYDWEILFTLQRNRRSVPMQYRLRTSCAGSMRRWSVPGMNGAGNGTGV